MACFWMWVVESITFTAAEKTAIAADSSNSHDHIECYHCHEFGHYAANCPRKQTRKAIDCHYCGKLDHFERNCYKKANDERAKTGGNHYRNRGPNKDFQRGPGRRKFH